MYTYTIYIHICTYVCMIAVIYIIYTIYIYNIKIDKIYSIDQAHLVHNKKKIVSSLRSHSLVTFRLVLARVRFSIAFLSCQLGNINFAIFLCIFFHHHSSLSHSLFLSRSIHNNRYMGLEKPKTKNKNFRYIAYSSYII